VNDDDAAHKRTAQTCYAGPLSDQQPWTPYGWADQAVMQPEIRCRNLRLQDNLTLSQRETRTAVGPRRRRMSGGAHVSAASSWPRSSACRGTEAAWNFDPWRDRHRAAVIRRWIETSSSQKLTAEDERPDLGHSHRRCQTGSGMGSRMPCEINGILRPLRVLASTTAGTCSPRRSHRARGRTGVHGRCRPGGALNAWREKYGIFARASTGCRRRPDAAE
jgi:hypothetical protein